MSKRTETGWAIVGAGNCLYEGWWATRRDAIENHIACLEDLNDGESAAWKRRRAKGDRAIKVQISWDAIP